MTLSSLVRLVLERAGIPPGNAAQMQPQMGRHHGGAERQETEQGRAERMLAVELKQRGWTADQLAARRKGDREKVKVARRLRGETMTRSAKPPVGCTKPDEQQMQICRTDPFHALMVLRLRTIVLAILLATIGSGCGTIHEKCVRHQFYQKSNEVLVLNVKTHVFVWPSHRAVPEGDVVYVGGNPSWGMEADRILTMLAMNGFRGWSYDRPRQGFSAGLRGESIDAHLNHLNALIQSNGIARPFLIGHSWGGALSLLYAARYPVSGVILLGSEVQPDDGLQDCLMAIYTVPLVGRVISETIGQPIAWWVASGEMKKALAVPKAEFKTNQSVRAYHRRARAYVSRQSNIRAMVRAETLMLPALEALWSDTNRVAHLTEVPITALFGELDEIVKPVKHSRRLNEHFPHAIVIPLPDAGHQLHITRPECVVEATLVTAKWASQGVKARPLLQDFKSSCARPAN